MELFLIVGCSLEKKQNWQNLNVLPTTADLPNGSLRIKIAVIHVNLLFVNLLRDNNLKAYLKDYNCFNFSKSRTYYRKFITNIIIWIVLINVHFNKRFRMYYTIKKIK